MSQIEEFHQYRSRMNERILAADSKIIKRMYNLDTNTYKAGALDVKTKELLGLVSSMVLRRSLKFLRTTMRPSTTTRVLLTQQPIYLSCF